jgi:hypothetical protein
MRYALIVILAIATLTVIVGKAVASDDLQLTVSYVSGLSNEKVAYDLTPKPAKVAPKRVVGKGRRVNRTFVARPVTKIRPVARYKAGSVVTSARFVSQLKRNQKPRGDSGYLRDAYHFITW